MTGNAETMKTAELNCPSCGVVVFPGEGFCEACGHRLSDDAEAAEDTAPAPAAAAVSAAAGGCVGCGGSAIDADGYCERCGLRQPAERDHVEVELPGRAAAGVSDRGKRYARNEDAMALAGHAGGVAAVVSDGVGSSPNPDDASRTAADTALAELVARLADGSAPDAAMRAAIARASDAVAALAASPAEAPSCTFVSAVTAPGSVTVGWIGDSRAYWLPSAAPAAPNGSAPRRAPGRDAGSPLDTLDPAEADRPELRASRALTTDDSWAAYMIAEGTLTEAEAEVHPNAHVITGWLGADNDDLRPHVATFVPDPDVPGTLLVCSDGLWNYLPGAEDLAAVLAEAAADPAADPLGAARALVRRALDAGGRDNITVAVIPLPARTTTSPSSPLEHAR
ncbi:PP2C family protein-serine/threonine phosphatase [Actinomadura rugatobispora]|uniref:PP2C family protein-serine/threonine phosphatase n=1 Tax=Actinomadura rugatobispora TaxID=1994 RepID=A0ABW1AFR8_9ACTN|nr:hypothetical protein GCM10010200_068110 [Actinomadura rugatobispora]